MKITRLRAACIVLLLANISHAAESLDPTPLNNAVNEKLKKHITVDFKATPLKDALKKIEAAIGAMVVIDPRLEDRKSTPVTLRIADTTAEAVLEKTLTQVNVQFGVRQGVVFISEIMARNAPPYVEPPREIIPANEPRWRKDLREQLTHRVTFDFNAVPLDKALAQLTEQSHVKINLIPRPGEDMAKVTLRVTDLPLSTALDFISKLLEYGIELKESGVEFAKPK